MKQEIWKDVVGYEGYYKVSNNGVIISLERNVYHPLSKTFLLKEKTLKQHFNSKRGYPSVCLHRNGEQKIFFVHRLVALAFIQNPENKPCINHINGIKTDSRVENLEWVTYKENTRHSYDVLLRAGSRCKKYQEQRTNL